MSALKSLALAIEVAERARDQADQAWQQARRGVQFARGQLEQLESYAADTEARWATAAAVTVSAELMQVLSPYLTLGEKLGSLQAQLLREAPRELRIEYAGDMAEDLRPVTLAVLRGLLNGLMESSTVNYVNAPDIAAERGLKIVESMTSASKGYSQLSTVHVRTASGEVEVAGAVFGRDVIRLVKINHFYLEAVPEGYILMLHNRDVPGVVGAVGTPLGEVGVNIAGLQLGREPVGGMAI